MSNVRRHGTPEIAMRLAALLVTSLVLGGCASKPYRDTDVSAFKGALDVRWVQNDYFLFLPNKDDPFLLRRKNGDVIAPGRMYTDGGSIPRFLWGVKGYSPWGYAPAYIVHDWLFEAHHCGYTPDNRYSFEDSVAVLAEGLKAVMEQNVEVRDYFVFDSVTAAVGSPIAQRLWEKGTCQAPAFNLNAFPGEEAPGELLMTIRFE
jgi:Protein of unknown function (DUF1353)